MDTNNSSPASPETPPANPASTTPPPVSPEATGQPAQTPPVEPQTPAAPGGSPTPTPPAESEKKDSPKPEEPPHPETPTNPETPKDPAAPAPHPKKSVPMIFIILLLIFSFIGGLGLAAWYFQNQFQKTQPVPANTADVSLPKQIVIGTDPTFQPMEYTNKSGGLLGFDIDLGYRIANDWGTKAEFRSIPWESLFKSLEEKKIDMIISGVSITEERAKLYDFSEPYLNAGQVIITRRENTTLHNAEDLMGKKIAVQKGTTNETEALKRTNSNLVISYVNFEEATKALVAGKADAILSDLPSAKGIILANPELKIASDPFTSETYGIVFRKGDPNVKKVNEILSSLRTKGILTDLKQKWLD